MAKIDLPDFKSEADKLAKSHVKTLNQLLSSNEKLAKKVLSSNSKRLRKLREHILSLEKLRSSARQQDLTPEDKASYDKPSLKKK